MAELKFLLIDTGPLWELILYSAVRDLGFERLRPELTYMKSEEQFRNLGAFIQGFSKRLTTPHVVCEISAWTMRTPKSGHLSLWRFVFDEFRRMQMNEETIELLGIPMELVANLGATDGGLVRVASRLGPRVSTVLSIDSALIAECRDAGLQALHLWEVIAAELA